MFNRDQLTGKNIVVYDTEIKESIDGINVTWKTFDKMGLSVACLFDYELMDYKVYLEDNLSELADRLNRADLITAFNQIEFDNKLVRACGLPLLSDDMLRQYDMLFESRKSVGWIPGSRNYPSGCKLDDHLLATFGRRYMKTSNGEEAPKMYQRKEMGTLISYCLADVARERALFEHIWEERMVRTEKNGIHAVAHPSRFFRK